MFEKLKEKAPFGFDPLPYLKKMNMPGLWLLWAADQSIPVPETVVLLGQLINTDKKNFSYQVFDNASHFLSIGGQLVPDYWKSQDEFLNDKVNVKFN